MRQIRAPATGIEVRRTSGRRYFGPARVSLVDGSVRLRGLGLGSVTIGKVGGQSYIRVAAASALRITAASAGVPFSFSNSP